MRDFKPDPPGYGAVMYHVPRFRLRVQQLAELITEIRKQVEFDAIVVTGKSGVAFAFALQMLIDVNIVVVRKPCDVSHGNRVEGCSAIVNRYLFLDDLVATGCTLNTVVGTLAEYASETASVPPKCVGIVTYEYDSGKKRQAAYAALNYNVPWFELRHFNKGNAERLVAREVAEFVQFIDGMQPNFSAEQLAQQAPAYEQFNTLAMINQLIA